MFVSLSVAMLPKLRTSSADSSYSTTQHNTVINLMASVLRKVVLGTPFGEGAEESAGLDHLERWVCIGIVCLSLKVACVFGFANNVHSKVWSQLNDAVGVSLVTRFSSCSRWPSRFKTQWC